MSVLFQMEQIATNVWWIQFKIQKNQNKKQKQKLLALMYVCVRGTFCFF